MSEEIINGVNVAECGYFDETDKECNICGMGTSGEDTFCRYCKDNSNCYYKQLKRFQAENEKLKKEFKEEHAELLMSRAENERLKEEIQKEKEIYKENVHYLACMTSQRNKLKLALEEIREILFPKNKWIITDCEEILEIQKITNEVLDERN